MFVWTFEGILLAAALTCLGFFLVILSVIYMLGRIQNYFKNHKKQLKR